MPDVRRPADLSQFSCNTAHSRADWCLIFTLVARQKFSSDSKGQGFANPEKALRSGGYINWFWISCVDGLWFSRDDASRILATRPHGIAGRS